MCKATTILETSWTENNFQIEVCSQSCRPTAKRAEFQLNKRNSPNSVLPGELGGWIYFRRKDHATSPQVPALLRSEKVVLRIYFNTLSPFEYGISLICCVRPSISLARMCEDFPLQNNWETKLDKAHIAEAGMSLQLPSKTELSSPVKYQQFQGKPKNSQEKQWPGANIFYAHKRFRRIDNQNESFSSWTRQLIRTKCNVNSQNSRACCTNERPDLNVHICDSLLSTVEALAIVSRGRDLSQALQHVLIGINFGLQHFRGCNLLQKFLHGL